MEGNSVDVSRLVTLPLRTRSVSTWLLLVVSEGLLGLAAVAVVDGDLSHAARLRGAAAAHGYGQQQDDVEARLDAAFFGTARTRHGADAWDTAVREGAQLNFEDAIAYALDQQRVPSAHAASTT